MEAPPWPPRSAPRSPRRCWITSLRCRTRASMPRCCIHCRKSCFWCCRRRIAGADDFVETTLWGTEHLGFLRRFYRYESGIPSHDTLCDVFAALDPALFKACFLAWINDLRDDDPDIIAIDGKTSRRSHDRRKGRNPLHLVSAWAARQRIVLGQQMTEEKSNEITAIPLLLRHLDLKGALVTMDAMGTQTDIAQAIRDGGGDYCMSLKKNWPAVYADVEQLFADPPDDVVFETSETVDLAGGRIETRRHTVCHKVDWMTSDRHYPGEPVFPDLAMIGRIETEIERNGAIEHETRYLSVLDRPLRCHLRACRAGSLGGGEPATLGVGRHLPRRSGTLQNRPRTTEHGHYPPHRAQSALARQTYRQSEKPTETRRVECRLPGNPHPPDRMTFKRFPCPGAPQVAFAVESHIDMIAYEMGLDPLEMRQRNAIVDGDLTPLGETRRHLRCRETIEAGARAFGWDKPKPPDIGRGISIYEHPPGNFGRSTVTLTLGADGRITLMLGSPDTGTGFHTIAAQLVAEHFGISVAEVEIVQGDTLSSGFEAGSSGQRLTTTIGQAIAAAADKMKQDLTALAAERLNCAPADVQLGGDGSFSAAGATITLRPLMAWGAARGKATLSCQGENAPGQPNDRTSFVAHFAEVAVDRETGQVRVRRIVTAHDVGTIINPITHQGQVEGGLIQAFGQAMSERIVLKDGAVITAHLGDYKLPTIADIPKLETVLLPGGSGVAPFSTTAIGEMSNVALPAAITNAVFDAVGVRLRELPVSAEKVLEGLSDRASTA